MKNNYQGSENHINNARLAGEKGREVNSINKEKRIKEYYLNPIKCLTCQGDIPYEKKNENKYCNHKCRAVKINPTKNQIRSNETRSKISISLGGDGIVSDKKRSYSTKPKTEEEMLLSESELKSKRMKDYYKNNPEAKFRLAQYSKNRVVTDDTRQKLRENMKVRIKNGQHKGWSKRNKPSYPEKFFMEVLKNNNIPYEFEKKVGKYFIDFAINEKMIALEIDGKQHKFLERQQKDKEKDEFLKSENWNVYRIEWREINSLPGKDYIKKEIEKFIKFNNSLKNIIT